MVNGNLALFVGLGVLFLVLAVPLMLGRIPPNGLYGFRTSRTVSNPELWYPVNAYTGRLLFAFGVLEITLAVALWFVPGIDPFAYAMACTGGLVAGVLAIVWMGFRFLRQYPS